MSFFTFILSLCFYVVKILPSVTTVGGNGATALVTINNFTGVFDPINGTQSNFGGTAATMQLITGVTKDYNYNATSTVVGNLIVTDGKKN